MSGNAAIPQADGSVRARIMQGTQQEVGPLLIGVMGAHAAPQVAAGTRAPQVRLEVLASLDSGVRSPGVVGLDVGSGLRIDGIGELVLVHLEDPAGPTEVSEPGAAPRATVFLELRPA